MARAKRLYGETKKNYYKRTAQKRHVHKPGKQTINYLNKINPEPLQFPDEMLLDVTELYEGVFRRKFTWVHYP